MIRQLMKRDPAWRSAPVLTLANGAFCVLWHFLALKADMSSNLIFFSVFAGLPFTAGYVAATQQDDTRFQSALPVTVRQVYLARVLVMIGLLWLPAAVSVAILLALPNPAAPVPTLVEFVSVWTLAMVGTQSAGVHGFTVPRSLLNMSAFIWMFGAGIAPTAGWLSGENTAGFVFLTLICWLAAAAIFLRTWHTVPASFQSAPLEASPVAVSGGIASSRRMPTTPWIPVLRSVIRWGGLNLAFLFVFMAIGSLRPMMIIFLASAWPSARPRVRWLFALPVHRRALLAAVELPIILAFAGGYLVGVHLPSVPAMPYARRISVQPSQGLPGFSLYRLDENCKTLNVLPSVDFWTLANRGIAPVIQAPWGEIFQPPVFRNSGFDIFNPYAVGCGNSNRFLNWQFSRATIAVYGRPIPLGKKVGWEAVDTHVVVTSLRTQFVTVAFIMGLAMFGTIGMLLNDWHRFRRLPNSVRVSFLSVAGAAGFALMMLDIGNKFSLSQWMLWALPQSVTGAAAIAVPSLAILYWVLDTLFRQVEIVDKPEASAA